MLVGTIESLIAKAQSYMAYAENPDGSTQFGQWFAQHIGQPDNRDFIAGNWCDMFIAYCASATDNAAVGVFSYVPDHENWFKSQGIWHSGTAGIRRGDIVIFDWEGDGTADHIGIVTGADSTGVYTIEGNTSNTVALRSHTSAMVGYGRPKYTGKDIMATGIDYAFGVHPPTAVLHAAGVSFVCRYISSFKPNDTNGKNLTAVEARGLLASNIAIVVVVEEGSDRMLAGRAAGVADAQHANAVVKALGMPTIPVYFACDFDATEGNQTAINAYLDGAASIIGHARVGLYGGYWPCVRAAKAGKAKYFWQTRAWSGTNVPGNKSDLGGFTRNIFQGAGLSMGGASVDEDTSFTADYGQWPRPAVKPPIVPPVKDDKAFHGEYVTGGQFNLADLADKLGYPVNTLLRMTAVHYQTFGNDLGQWLSDVLTGETPFTTPVPAGVKLWCD